MSAKNHLWAKACLGLRQGAAILSAFVFLAPALAPGQQFRAAWADVFHNGMQNSNQVDTMISCLVTGRYNAVIVQVLAYMDKTNGSLTHGAYWQSTNVPWCGYTTTTFDPLQYACQQAHAKGIQVYAWLGGSAGCMYRVSNAWPPPNNPTLAAHPEWMMVPYTNSEGGAVMPFTEVSSTATNNYYLLDMGSPDAQEYIVKIVRELVGKYPIDGITWDDEIDGVEYDPIGIGYPAKSTATYTRSGLARYCINTGYSGATPVPTNSAYGDYRRRFKNELLARCQAEIQSIKTNPRQPVRHTAAVMAYGGPPSDCTFTKEEAYLYYSDWPTMLKNGWLDAAIPMNYKAHTNSTNAKLYTDYCDRAFSCWRYSRHIYMGLGAYLNTKSNTLVQLKYAYYTNGYNGAVTYSYYVPYASAYDTDSGNWWTNVATNLYTTTATVPMMPWRDTNTATEGIMWGQVKDANTGLYVDDATVTVTGGPTVKTDGNGYYVATLIPASAAGTVHSTVASKAGAISATNSTATVLAGDVVRYDFTLNDTVPPLGVFQTKTNAVVVWWNSTPLGWSLVQKTDLAGADWIAPSQTVKTNNTNCFIIVSPPSGTCFYRLMK
jgi:uncharacterized lipoprotein YddW (UPF0748 family)